MDLLKTPTFWLVIAAIVATVVVVIAKFRGKRGWGFRELVKNPELWDGMEEARLRNAQAAEEAKQWDDREVEAEVRHFIFDAASGQEAQKQILLGLGERLYSPVLRILGDAALRPRLVKPMGKELVPVAPFNRACDLLGDIPPREAVGAVAPFLSNADEEIRKDAALVLGKTGSPEIVALLRQALSDPDEYVRSYGLMGLNWAIKNQRLSDECRRELFDDVRRLLTEGKNADNAAELLLNFDQRKAVDFFLTDFAFNPEAVSLYRVLRALGDKRLPVPRDRLFALIRLLDGHEQNFPQCYNLHETLRLLGQHRLPEDRPLLETWSTNKEREVAAGAAAGLLASNALEGFREALWAKETASGYASLTEPQRHYLAVLALDAEINNGGLSQYFVNSGGDNWRDALAGLEAMESRERIAILREALAKFGNEGPAEDRDIRQKQLARLARRDDKLFDALDDRYYKSTEVFEVMAARYVLKHAAAFK